MVKVKEDMTGWKMWEHGVPDSKLTVIKQVDDYIAQNGRHYAQWLCECSCEEHNSIIVLSGNLKRINGTKSCGCISKKYNNVQLNLEDEHGLYGIGYRHNTGKEFYFDMDDYNKLKNICWTECIRHGMKCLVGTNPTTKKTVTMHVFLGYKWYDHADRNELNNRKYNLRPATASQQATNRKIGKNNTSGFKGLSWSKRENKWRVRVHINKKDIYIGAFKNKEDAIKARLEAEALYYGEFAPQRHLFEQYNVTSPIDETVQN